MGGCDVCFVLGGRRAYAGFGYGHGLTTVNNSRYTVQIRQVRFFLA